MKTKIKKFLGEKVKIMVVGVCFIIWLVFFIPLRQSFGMVVIPERGVVHDIIVGSRGITDDDVWDEIEEYREDIETALPDDVDIILGTDPFDSGFIPGENIPTASPPNGDFIPHFPFGFHIGGGAYNAGSEQDDESNITVGGISFKKSGDAAISGSLIVNDNNIFRSADATCNPDRDDACNYDGCKCQRDYGIISEGKKSGVIAKSNTVGMKGIGKLTGIIGEGGFMGGIFTAVDADGGDITDSQVALGVNFGSDMIVSILSLGATVLANDLFIGGNIAGLGSPVTINDDLVVNGNIGRFYVKDNHAHEGALSCDGGDIIISCSARKHETAGITSIPTSVYYDESITGCGVDGYEEPTLIRVTALCFSPDG